MTNLLGKISSIINSRSDILAADSESASTNQKDSDSTILTNVEPTLPKSLSNTSTISQQIETNLLPLLGGADSARFKQYKNDTKLMDDTLSKQAIGLLLQMENINEGTTATTGSRGEDDEEEGEGGEYELVSGELTSHLTMDRTAMECINLLPQRHAGISNVVVGGSESNNSLFGVLNQCKTKMGVRMLEMWLRQPCVDYKTIMYRQSAVHKMVDVDGLGRDRLRDEGLGGLRGVDLDGLCVRLASFMDTNNTGGTSRSLECLYRLHLFADQQLPLLMESMADLASSSEESKENEEGKVGGENEGEEEEGEGAILVLYNGLQRVFNELSKSVQLVEAVLDFDVAPREFLVKPTFNEELAEIRNELDGIEQEREEIHENMNQVWEEISSQRGQVRLEQSDSNNGSSCAWQFRIPDTNASKILQKSTYFFIISSRLVLYTV